MLQRHVTNAASSAAALSCDHLVCIDHRCPQGLPLVIVRSAVSSLHLCMLLHAHAFTILSSDELQHDTDQHKNAVIMRTLLP